MKGGAKVVIEAHRHDGVFIARGKEDALVTRNLVPGISVYGEKRMSVEQNEGEKVRGLPNGCACEIHAQRGLLRAWVGLALAMAMAQKVTFSSITWLSVAKLL